MGRRAYSRVVSLGSNCAVARELERFGLRDASYPFDWITSPIAPVLELLETSFDGFLTDASVFGTHPLFDSVLVDERNGLQFHHDFDAALPLDAQLPGVRDKFMRRAERLMSNTEPTLFVRYVMDDAEYAWAKEHARELLELVRRQNDSNDLVLVANVSYVAVEGGSVHELCGVPAYCVDKPIENVMGFVSTNRALRRRLFTVGYPSGARARNLARYWLPIMKNGLRSGIAKTIGEARLQRILAVVRG